MANLSTTTFKQADQLARDLSGASDRSILNQATAIRYGNLVLQKIARLISPLYKPWGRSTSTLTNLKATGVIHYPSGGGSYSHTTKTLTGVTGLDQTYVGGWGLLVDVGGGSGHIGLIDTVPVAGTSCVFRVLLSTTAAPANPIGSTALLAFLKPNPVYYEGANFGSVNILDVVKVVDATTGNAVRLPSDEFASFGDNPNYDSSVVVEYAGEGMYLGKGSSVSTFGTLTMTYDEKPTSISAITDTIDLPEQYVDMYVQEMARLYTNHIEQPVPPNLEHPLKILEAEYKRVRKENMVKVAQKYKVADRRER